MNMLSLDARIWKGYIAKLGQSHLNGVKIGTAKVIRPMENIRLSGVILGKYC